MTRCPVDAMTSRRVPAPSDSTVSPTAEHNSRSSLGVKQVVQRSTSAAAPPLGTSVASRWTHCVLCVEVVAAEHVGRLEVGVECREHDQPARANGPSHTVEDLRVGIE